MSTVTAPVLRTDRSARKAARIFNQDRLRWLDEAQSLGPFVRLRFGRFLSVWVLSDAETAHDVLIASAASWRRPPALMTPIRMAGGENLFTLPDRAWSGLQPAVSPELRKRALEPRLATLPELVSAEMAALPMETTIDLDQAMARLTMIVAAWVLFGKHLDRSRADDLFQHERAAIDWVGDRMGSALAPLPFASRALRAHRKAVLRFSQEIVDERLGRAGGGHDLLDALLEARPNGRKLALSELRSHVAGFFLAGTETTAAALGWAMVHGHRNPAEWARLREEPESASAFVAETLRLTPPAWGIPRAPVGPGVQLRIGGSLIPVRRHESISIYIRGINRDPQLWSHPEEFIPDRHSHLTKEQERALLPFGLGPRGCIGQHLALSELVTALPVLASRGDIHIEGQAAEDPHFVLRVRGGLRGRFSKGTRDWKQTMSPITRACSGTP